ncbi:acetyltransferase, GNAT family [Ancylostoma caninum]|uniref:N-alpha-acetyltransferase 20 n=1 Tax=Ancylostoma caninum TaxID=29170 RepID=A0A368H8V9_ANCCA|nr:acetyltransferase, GNAT family [Ancylostoma caninum]
MVSGRTVKEVGVFAGLIVVMHYAYYTIQNNPSLVAPEQRSELFYMTTIRPFDVMDMLKFNNVNLDSMTETYGFNFYLYYLVNWPEYYQVAEHPNGQIMGYIMGKAEGRDENWHGHVTALSVAPDYRRLGLGARMMYTLEHISDMKKAYFVDLFVRVSNHVAISMYKALGYVVYREIIDYYSGPHDENAYEANQKEKFSIFTGIQYGTTAMAVLLMMRTSNKFLTHAQRGKTIVGAAGCLYLSVAIEFGLFPFNFFVKEKVSLRKT